MPAGDEHNLLASIGLWAEPMMFPVLQTSLNGFFSFIPYFSVALGLSPGERLKPPKPAPTFATRRTHVASAVRLFPNTMAASMSRLPELPTEILEQVLLHLPGQDVVEIEAVRCVPVIPKDSALTFRWVIQVSRRFQDLTRDSPALQSKRALFSAGLVENSCSPSGFSQRRKLCKSTSANGPMRGW